MTWRKRSLAAVPTPLYRKNKVDDDIETQTQPYDTDGNHEKGQEISNIALDTIKVIEQIANGIELIANDFAELSHTADHSYVSLTLTMGTILYGTAFLNMWIFALPYHSVNGGHDANRWFLYGVLSFNEFIALIPWIETINDALPDAKIPAWSRMVAVGAGILSQKLLDS